MTTEPRQEAERIVFQVGSGRKQAQRFHESEGEFFRRRNALVDVLAAAIEVVETADTSNATHEEPVSVWMDPYDRLHEALTALREYQR